MGVRCKMVVESVTENDFGGTTIKLDCRYDDSIPEDQRFYDATPMGSCEMLVNNPAAIEQFKEGQAFYLDFTPAA